MLHISPNIKHLALELARDDFPRDMPGPAERETREHDVEAARGDSAGDGYGDAIAAAQQVRSRGPAVARGGELGAGEEEHSGGDAVDVHGPEFLDAQRVGGVEEGAGVEVEEGGDAGGFVGGLGGGAVGEGGPDFGEVEERGGGEGEGGPFEVVVVGVREEFVGEVMWGGELGVGEGVGVDVDGALGELEVPGFG